MQSAAVVTFVAVSAAEAVQAVAKVFEQETAIKVKISSGPSNALAQQILNGSGRGRCGARTAIIAGQGRDLPDQGDGPASAGLVTGVGAAARPKSS